MDPVLGTQILLSLVDRVIAWKITMDQAKAEGREVNAADVQKFLSEDDLARANLVAELARH